MRSQPQPRWREWWDDEFLSNNVFGALVALGKKAPSVVRPAATVASRALGSRTFTDVSHRVFTSPRRVRFVEMEYAVPRADLVPVVRELVDQVERSDLRIAFPVEVRVAAADDITLSTASGRDSGYVAVHLPPGVDHDGVLRPRRGRRRARSAADRTGASCTPSTPRRCASAIRASTSSSRSGTASTRTACCATTISTVSWVDRLGSE